jgi:hypothetical protein
MWLTMASLGGTIRNAYRVLVENLGRALIWKMKGDRRNLPTLKRL